MWTQHICPISIVWLEILLQVVLIFPFCGQICESLTSGPSHAIDITREVGIWGPFQFRLEPILCSLLKDWLILNSSIGNLLVCRLYRRVLMLWLQLEVMELFMRFATLHLLKTYLFVNLFLVTPPCSTCGHDWRRIQLGI